MSTRGSAPPPTASSRAHWKPGAVTITYSSGLKTCGSPFSPSWVPTSTSRRRSYAASSGSRGQTRISGGTAWQQKLSLWCIRNTDGQASRQTYPRSRLPTLGHTRLHHHDRDRRNCRRHPDDGHDARVLLVQTPLRVRYPHRNPPRPTLRLDRNPQQARQIAHLRRRAHDMARPPETHLEPNFSNFRCTRVSRSHRILVGNGPAQTHGLPHLRQQRHLIRLDQRLLLLGQQGENDLPLRSHGR